MGIPKIKNITDLRMDAKNIIEGVNKGNQTVITHKSGDVVLVPVAEYTRLLEHDEVQAAFDEDEEDRKSGFTGYNTDDIFAMLYKKYGFLNGSKAIKTSKKRS